MSALTEYLSKQNRRRRPHRMAEERDQVNLVNVVVYLMDIYMIV